MSKADAAISGVSSWVKAWLMTSATPLSRTDPLVGGVQAIDQFFDGGRQHPSRRAWQR
ncbi:MAG: hypothetical protein IPJ48_11570 [Propionivibrio sp.]|uniref:Uncharacterized protein n=1 Tax=Candidatus Propionivibrio dominans TaxID=2954373 RepID=A0A9D7I914_9RHOO|nr:hypothetical protein [Candidatus Propionivibrio dominans]